MESEGLYKQAERHFVKAHDWKEAVNMYRTKDLWDDAYRVRESLYLPMKTM